MASSRKNENNKNTDPSKTDFSRETKCDVPDGDNPNDFAQPNRAQRGFNQTERNEGKRKTKKKVLTKKEFDKVPTNCSYKTDYDSTFEDTVDEVKCGKIDNITVDELIKVVLIVLRMIVMVIQNKNMNKVQKNHKEEHKKMQQEKEVKMSMLLWMDLQS